ncbi:MAG: Rrf2 family transcriptional regulator [Phycisphaerae bacterium]|nr:Rrf2 family transcriptional regulator [Phycisphaerae bacterium]
MITLSQKCQYALRGVFELARRSSTEPIAVAEIAAAQAIPPRFLEIIFADLRQAGVVKSIRGNRGGHMLARPASEITVGEIIRLAEGPINLVKCVSGSEQCPFIGHCPFMSLWDEATAAMGSVFDKTSIQDMVEREKAEPDRMCKL